MELWIRSQDKSCLVNIKAVIMLNKEIRGYYNENPNWFLGKYDTEGRALEVLDEIQHKIINSNYYDYDDDGYINYINNISHDNIVYEMPKE